MPQGLTETDFPFPGQVSDVFFQWLNEWDRVFLFGQVWMILHFPLTMIFLKWHFWGTMQLQRLHGTPKKSFPGAKSLRLPHPCNPINPLHRVCQIVLMCIYVCMWVFVSIPDSHSTELLPMEREHMHFTHICTETSRIYPNLSEFWGWD